MKIGLIEIAMLISTSCSVSFTVTLNRYAIHKQNSKNTILLVYISEALLSTVSGFILSLLFTTFVDNIFICVVASAVGAFLGKNSLEILSKVILYMLKKYLKIDDLEATIPKESETARMSNIQAITQSLENDLKELDKLKQSIEDTYTDEREKLKALDNIENMKNELLQQQLSLLTKGENENGR